MLGVIFPITLGGIELYDSKVAPDTKNHSSPVCMCDSPVRVGIIGSFWEPVRLVDVSHEPYCFSNMGGMKMDLGIKRNQVTRGKASSSKTSALVCSLLHVSTAILVRVTYRFCLFRER